MCFKAFLLAEQAQSKLESGIKNSDLAGEARKMRGEFFKLKVNSIPFKGHFSKQTNDDVIIAMRR